MRSRHVRFVFVALTIAIVTTIFVFIPMFKTAMVRAERASLEAVARRFPNFTIEQRPAILRERQAQRHPSARDMSFGCLGEEK